MAGAPGFIGREAELSWLLRALGGDARLVLVVGDAGVGKTRFVAEGMARAAAAGMLMVRGECLPLAGPTVRRAVYRVIAMATGELPTLIAVPALPVTMETGGTVPARVMPRCHPG